MNATELRNGIQELVDEMRAAYDMSDEEIYDTITSEVQLTETETQTLAKILGLV